MAPKRIRDFLCISAIVWQCLIVPASLACPTNTTALAASSTAPTPSWCLRFYSASPLNFCDAFRTCRSNGERMIDRPVLDAMRSQSSAGSSLFDTSHYWWVGLTDALNERSSSRDGWVWISDGRVTTAAEGAAYFQASEPNDQYRQDCVTTVTGSAPHRLRDARCDDVNLFYCYTDAVANAAAAAASSDRTRQFVASPIATFSQPDPGCWTRRRLATYSSVTACASVCFEYGWFGDCVGFYWNSARQECVFLQYFDAAVPLEFANDWEVKQWRKYILNSDLRA